MHHANVYNISIQFKLGLQSLIDRPKELLELINECLKPKQVEKKKFGEVFTPMKLVNEMLDKLPKEVWTNKKLKWFDPAAGMGNFPIAVYLRLMKSLKDEISNDNERKKYIIENMLYMSELNKKNCFIIEQIFNIDKKYKLNLHNGDTLKMDTKKIFDVEKFDIVMGNPPYQPDSNGKKGGKSLWTLFVHFAMKQLKKNGYLVFVHPALWRKPENEMRNIFFKYQIIYLSIHSDAEGYKIFGATTRYDWYVMQKNNTSKKTIVEFEDNKICDVMINDNLKFIPNFGWSIWNKVLNKHAKIGGLNAQCDSMCHTSRDYVASKKTDEYKYELINSISESKGTTYKYSKKPHPKQEYKKVIFSNGRKIVPIYDDGKYGTTQGGIYICVENDDDGKRLVNYLKSNLVKYLVRSTKWSNFETIKQIFWNITNPIGIKDVINQETINKYFEFDDEEIKVISMCK